MATLDECSSVCSESETEVTPRACKRRRQSMYCGHCDSYLPKSTYYRHREAFFDSISLTWQRKHTCFQSKDLEEHLPTVNVPESSTNEPEYTSYEGKVTYLSKFVSRNTCNYLHTCIYEYKFRKIRRKGP